MGVYPVAMSVAPVISADKNQTGQPGSLFSAVCELTKPRITRLVTITTGVGFVLSAIAQSWQMTDLSLRALGCIVGTAFSASGANALNQWWEQDRDAVMPRTCARPIPTHRVSTRAAFGWGMLFSVLGVGILLCVGLAPALISFATILIYVLLYTPLKPITTLNTIVGAVPGALPPLIGWASAATGNHLRDPSGSGMSSLTDLGGWSLFALMFVWQIPHFLAIAWMYRDDYAKGGYRMLANVDPTGAITARMILLWSFCLIPATLAPALVMHDRLSAVSAVAAVLTGIAFTALCLTLARTRERRDARRVFFASIAHLPILLLVMVADAVGVAILR